MTTHALYRFYDSTGGLLYIGITSDPGARFGQHRGDKPWWTEVANIGIEQFSDRASVLTAERAAIVAERPRYNIIHNRPSSLGTARIVPEVERESPIQIGDWVALALHNGECPVGEVAALDSIWISIRLKNFAFGVIDPHIRVVRWADIDRLEAAYPEDAEPSEHGGRAMQDRHLGHLQTAWNQLHNGETRCSPLDDLLGEARQQDRGLRYDD